MIDLTEPIEINSADWRVWCDGDDTIPHSRGNVNLHFPLFYSVGGKSKSPNAHEISCAEQGAYRRLFEAAPKMLAEIKAYLDGSYASTERFEHLVAEIEGGA